MSIQVLDCTLRDGSYIVGGNFGVNTIKGLIGRLTRADIDIVECGWLKDAEYVIGSAYYHQPSDVAQFITEKNKNTLYVAMIDYNRYNVEALEQNDGTGIDAIRVVFPRGHEDEGLALVPKIKAKGYKVFLQIANTYGYSDLELAELVEKINNVTPVSISIVDTFGTMYRDDLYRIMTLIDHNLDKNIKLGFHSHNNQQLSFALAQDFVEYGLKKNRDIVVDSSLCGMGRGAGNVTTELLLSYLNKVHAGKNCKEYNLYLILDTIDTYMNKFIKNFKWGYTVPLFIAGLNCTHVNNIAYLLDRHMAKARDIQNTIEALTPDKRIAYDYDNLETTYLEYLKADIDDTDTVNILKKELKAKTVLLLAPGKSIQSESEKIKNYLNKKPVVIAVNWLPTEYDCDFVFFSSIKRYEYAKDQDWQKFKAQKKIITSNLSVPQDDNTVVVNYNKLLVRKWKYFENSLFLCLRLLRKVKPVEIGIAGMDGFSDSDNYIDNDLDNVLSQVEYKKINAELNEMLNDYLETTSEQIKIDFVTKRLQTNN